MSCIETTQPGAQLNVREQIAGFIHRDWAPPQMQLGACAAAVSDDYLEQEFWVARDKHPRGIPLDCAESFNHFAQQTLRLLSLTLGGNSALFYLTDDDLGYYGFWRLNIDDEHPLPRVSGARAFYGVGRDERPDRASPRGGGTIPPRRMVEFGEGARLAFRAVSSGTEVEMLFCDQNIPVAGVTIQLSATSMEMAKRLEGTARTLHSYIELNVRHLIARHTNVIDRARRYYSLTRKECEVVELISIGRTNAEIAHCLRISLSTVKCHTVNIFDKVGVGNRGSLVAMINRAGAT